MHGLSNLFILKLSVLICGLLLTTSSAIAQTWVDHKTSDNTTVVKRHETGSVVSGNKLYVLGGRGNRPVQVFDSAQNKWSTLAPLPIEMHHFQPVILNGYLYAIGAFTCCFPNEPSIADIYRLNLATNTWETHGRIPNARLRGSAGAVVYKNKIYLIGGNTNGHSGGAVDWLDEYDPSTGNWRTLPDAPNERDHFSAAIVGNKLIAASGRKTNGGFGGMVSGTDVFDFNTNRWSSVAPIPTPRAGTMLGVKNGNVIVMGGETDTQVESHDEVEAYHVATNKWRNLPDLGDGRHGGAGGVIGNTLHAITGNLFRGGGQEVTTHETLVINDADNDGMFDLEDNSNNSTNNNAPDNNNTNNNTDSDNDGLSDQLESQLGTDPQNQDTDGDNLSDGEEVNQHKTDPLESDSDNDGLQDSEELNLGTSPVNFDTDGDGLSDIDELQTHGTDPTLSDSDSDSLSDDEELQIHFTDPLLADSDNDGLDDDEEVLIHSSDPNSWDTDGDGISDAVEVSEGTSLNNTDEDGDGILNSAEGSIDSDGDSVPNFADLDSDNDGIPDIIENGRSDTDNNGQLDATDENAASDALFDADQDGISNLLDLDSDQDGLIDLIEAGQADTTGTGTLTNAEFVDNNANGWHDNLEGTAVPDTDADATPDFLDLDSNDDGVTDLTSSGIVDVNDDGMLDNFIDNNGDGVHDDIALLERIQTESQSPVTESDTSDQSGGQETEISAKTGGGSDPWLPLVMILLTFAVAIRQRQLQHQESYQES